MNSDSRAPILVTERLALRELRDGDAAAVATGAGDKRVAKYLIQVPTPYPVSLAKRWVIARREWWALGRGVTLAVTRRDEDKLLGTVSLRRYARDRRAELGYWLAVPAWGDGIATEAVRAIVDFGFRELVLARIYAQVIEGNGGSIRVLEKLGMVHEGIKRQHVRKGHRLCDVVLYGLLRSEWGVED
jgi:[ribosomal protein S5]-alanine N-acetyltransferase